MAVRRVVTTRRGQKRQIWEIYERRIERSLWIFKSEGKNGGVEDDLEILSIDDRKGWKKTSKLRNQAWCIGKWLLVLWF